MKRGFRSSAVTPVGITTVVCTVIIRELLALDQTNFFLVKFKIKCCVVFCDCRDVELLFSV